MAEQLSSNTIFLQVFQKREFYTLSLQIFLKTDPDGFLNVFHYKNIFVSFIKVVVTSDPASRSTNQRPVFWWEMKTNKTKDFSWNLECLFILSLNSFYDQKYLDLTRIYFFQFVAQTWTCRYEQNGSGVFCQYHEIYGRFGIAEKSTRSWLC